MARLKRKFTNEQKLEILQQAKATGVIAALHAHTLSYSVFARWREKFMKSDKEKQELMLRNKSKFEFKQILEENTRLKKIVADQALEMEKKDEELRKNKPFSGRR